jgi:hypothetical protein
MAIMKIHEIYATIELLGIAHYILILCLSIPILAKFTSNNSFYWLLLKIPFCILVIIPALSLKSKKINFVEIGLVLRKIVVYISIFVYFFGVGFIIGYAIYTDASIDSFQFISNGFIIGYAIYTDASIDSFQFISNILISLFILGLANTSAYIGIILHVNHKIKLEIAAAENEANYV